MMKKFMNPLVDAGFKRIFGRKMYMREFLNDLLMLEHPIKSVTFLDKEMVSASERDHGVVYDLYCVSEDDKFFIVEMQYKSHQYFKERTVYYMARNITEQSKYVADEDRGEWNYSLAPVYCIYLLNFHLESEEQDVPQRKVMLTDVLTNKVFYDRMTMYFLELPTYRSCAEGDCKRDIDKWLYILANMNRFKSFPFKEDKPVFKQMEELADIATFSKEEMRMYEDSLDRYRINRLTMKTCHDEGVEQGVKQVAKELKANGVSMEIIMKTTHLTQDEIEKL